MKFSTAKEHRDFFQKNGWIEFEDLVSQQLLEQVNRAVDRTVADRLTNPDGKTAPFSSEKHYLAGRDLWRADPLLKKFISQAKFAEIAVELTEKIPLRLGFDQLFPRLCESLYEKEPSYLYSSFLKEDYTLQEASCLSGLAVGIMLSLGPCSERLGSQRVLPDALWNREPRPGVITPFPSKPGHAVFFQPQRPIRWNFIAEQGANRFLLIVYTGSTAYYQRETNDPHVHALKKLGYVFNDRLTDRLHPVVIRQ